MGGGIVIVKRKIVFAFFRNILKTGKNIWIIIICLPSQESHSFPCQNTVTL